MHPSVLTGASVSGALSCAAWRSLTRRLTLTDRR
jgi:hypothetical protein